MYHEQTVSACGTDPELREADGQGGQLVVVQVQMLKARQVPQVIRQTRQLVFTQIHLHQVGQVAELWLHERNTSFNILSLLVKVSLHPQTLDSAERCETLMLLQVAAGQILYYF